MAVNKKKLSTIERSTPIEIAEWKNEGKFSIRSLRGNERDQIRERATKVQEVIAGNDAKAASDEVDKFNSFLVMIYLGDENGVKIFDESDFPTIKDLPTGIKDQIIAEGSKYNNLSDAEKKS